MRTNSGFLKTICLGLSLVILALSFCGCQGNNEQNESNVSSGQTENKVSNEQTENKATIEPMEVEKPDVYGFEFLGGTDVMPIAGYYGPMPSNYSVDGQSLPDYISDEFFEKIAECGINLLHHQYTNYATIPSFAKKLLGLGEKFNIGICVYDSRIRDNLGDDTLSVEDIDEIVNDYRNYPAFCGLYITDEPSSDYYYSNSSNPRLTKYNKLFANLKALDIFGYANLFPMVRVTQREQYEKYLQEYIDNCDVYYLSWDKYVFDKGNSKSEYFLNMSLCREYAEKANIPFWTFIQAGSQWNDNQQPIETNGYYPTEGEFIWNINTCLAYGAKGIQYFPLIQPNYFSFSTSNEFDFERNGIFGAWGNKNRWFYYAKNANAQIAAVDEVLMNSVNKGVIVTGEDAKKDNSDSKFLIDGDSWRELAGVSGDSLIGCFNYKGKSAFYVVNYDTEYAQKITLKLKGKYNLSVTQGAKTTYINTDELELTMAAGDGALVVVE